MVGQKIEDAAEVADLDVHNLVAVHHCQQVGWFDITVNEPQAKGVVQRHGALEAQLDHLCQWQQGVGATKAPQGDTGHVLHHQVGLTHVRDGIKNLHNVGVVQSPHQGGFSGKKTLLKVVLSGVAHGVKTHPFDGHVHASKFIVRQEHLARRPCAQAAQHRVLADVRWQIGVNVNGQWMWQTSGHGQAMAMRAAIATTLGPA